MNLDPVRAILEDASVDAVLLTSPRAFNWASGVQIPSHATMHWRHAALLIDKSGIRGVLCVDMEESTVRSAFPGEEVVVWKEFGGDLVLRLTEMLDIPGLNRLGYEGDHVPVWLFQALSAALPHLEWVDCRQEVELGRARKDESELALLKRLALAADLALHGALVNTRVGDTEHRVAGRILASLFDQGITEYKALLVASGERSWIPNVGPSDRVIRLGDVVRVEVFAMEKGYHAAVARTAVAGPPSDELTEAWSWIQRSRQAGLTELLPGADPVHVYRTYTDHLGPLKSRAMAFFAHGMGLDLHELPYVTAISTDTLEVGAVVGVEPWAMLPGKFGLQVKDVAVLKSEGPDVISNQMDGGELFVIGSR